ncbi:DUF551 domain-containing protein [Phytobacter diazotrophicus]|uniref:DUF551 domain-containing protein n=1 Tax=Phytobacter diazotrophicus TaxID=395631 RepID=UPI002FFA3BEF
MKEHEIRELVNRLRDIAIKYHNTQQLRERIAHAVNSAIKPGTLTNEGTIQSGNSGQVPDEKLPMNYLQGQKDGLEWAAQMAEASHPNTGDWLYDDPVELAKAIRKGPDMPAVSDGWIPVGERMPVNINTVVTSNGYDIGHGCWDGERWFEDDPVPEGITHWQPLPNPPDAPKGA